MSYNKEWNIRTHVAASIFLFFFLLLSPAITIERTRKPRKEIDAK